jgi:hypothetical protein
VHDWDSLVSRPEAAIAGVAAAVFPGLGGPGMATLEETAAFLLAYEHARGLCWRREDREVCWAAGLWIRAYNAKKDAVHSTGRALLERLASEAAE